MRQRAGPAVEPGRRAGRGGPAGVRRSRATTRSRIGSAVDSTTRAAVAAAKPPPWPSRCEFVASRKRSAAATGRPAWVSAPTRPPPPGLARPSASVAASRVGSSVHSRPWIASKFQDAKSGSSNGCSASPGASRRKTEALRSSQSRKVAPVTSTTQSVFGWW
jgi:hypothetical protein